MFVGFLEVANCGLPEMPEPNPKASNLTFLFNLAPGGVYTAPFVAEESVGFYPTISPFPAEGR